MHKILFPILLIGLFAAGCGEAAIAPTLTPTVTPTSVPDVLLAEIKLETQTGTAYSLSWSNYGETLAVASGGEIILINADEKEVQAIFTPEDAVLGVTWNPNQTQLATVGGFQSLEIKLWDFDVSNNQLTHAQDIPATSDQYGLAWSPDRKKLASLAGDSKSVIQVWDTSTWTMTQEFDLPYTKPRRALTWSADSTVVYSSGESKGQTVVFALNTTDGTVEELGKYLTSEAEVFAVSPDGSQIAISDPRGVVLIFDKASGEVVGGFKSVDQSVDMAWNPNGETLAILSYEGVLQLWGVE